MGVLANHVPSIEQLKAGVVEVIEEGGSSKRFFRTSRDGVPETEENVWLTEVVVQFPVVLLSFSPSRP
jgi:hypothetical protein